MTRAVTRVGVIGVGEIGAAIVESVVARPPDGGLEVVLSPRSRVRSAALDRRHRQVRVASDNQEVVDDADIVIVAVLPDQVENCCAELVFRADQVVVGLAAGWPPSRLGPVVAPATTVCQLIPLPMITLHAGPIVLYPRLPAVADLFDRCGTVVVPEREADIPMFSVASAVMSTYFAFASTLTDWMESGAIAPDTAKSYVASLLSGLGAEAEIAAGYGGVAGNRRHLAELVGTHETPGGLNEQLRRTLEEAGFEQHLRDGFDALLHRIRPEAD